MRKLELARAIAAKPKLFYFREAMAGLSASEVDDILRSCRVSDRASRYHDEHVMRRDEILRAHRGSGRRPKIADGPSSRGRNPEVVRAYWRIASASRPLRGYGAVQVLDRISGSR